MPFNKAVIKTNQTTKNQNGLTVFTTGLLKQVSSKPASFLSGEQMGGHNETSKYYLILKLSIL